MTAVEPWPPSSANAAEWQRLARRLVVHTGFAFLAVEVVGEPVARRVMDHIHELAAEHAVGLRVFGPGGVPRERSLVSALRASADGEGATSAWWVVPAVAPADRARFITEAGYLNQKRDEIKAWLRRPLVVLMHRIEWQVFRQEAPDLWSVRAATFLFDAPRHVEGTCPLHQRPLCLDARLHDGWPEPPPATDLDMRLRDRQIERSWRAMAERIVDAALDCGLDEPSLRMLLLDGIPDAVVRDLPVGRPAPSQWLSDLLWLGARAEGRWLLVWLANAQRLRLYGSLGSSALEVLHRRLATVVERPAIRASGLSDAALDDALDAIEVTGAALVGARPVEDLPPWVGAVMPEWSRPRWQALSDLLTLRRLDRDTPGLVRRWLEVLAGLARKQGHPLAAERLDRVAAGCTTGEFPVGRPPMRPVKFTEPSEQRRALVDALIAARCFDRSRRRVALGVLPAQLAARIPSHPIPLVALARQVDLLWSVPAPPSGPSLLSQWIEAFAQMASSPHLQSWSEVIEGAPRPSTTESVAPPMLTDPIDRVIDVILDSRLGTEYSGPVRWLCFTDLPPDVMLRLPVADTVWDQLRIDLTALVWSPSYPEQGPLVSRWLTSAADLIPYSPGAALLSDWADAIRRGELDLRAGRSPLDLYPEAPMRAAALCVDLGDLPNARQALARLTDPAQRRIADLGFGLIDGVSPNLPADLALAAREAPPGLAAALLADRVVALASLEAPAVELEAAIKAAEAHRPALSDAEVSARAVVRFAWARAMRGDDRSASALLDEVADVRGSVILADERDAVRAMIRAPGD